ncbi:YdcF family protein [Ideonella sp.]|uniref:YdcF family protein n=1 Tax=Ideonella sp. TaxID=1929293 RepID=UPI0035B15FE1
MDRRANNWRWIGGALGALLVADALLLMADGLFSLGVTLPLMFGVVLVALAWRWPRVQPWLSRQPGRRRAWRWGWAVIGAWAASVAVFWVVLARSATDVVTADAPAAIVVLGAGAPNGRPSPTLLARLDVALAQAARFPEAPVVVSGGLDFSGRISEAKVMGDYLRAKGLAPDRIVQEERSTSTEENLRFTQPLLAARGIDADAPVRLVTSDFHTIRARWIARRAGYARVQAVGAPTPLYVRYNAWLREYFAFVSGFVLREF